jgi:Domain of unknown function (DUF4157)
MYERALVARRRPAQQKADAGRQRLVQRRLTVGRADDPAEREADAIAVDVLARLRAGERGSVFDRPAGATRIQRASSADGIGGGDLSTDGEREVRTAGGSASGEAGVLRRMEPAFGADFGGVRIHTGANVDVAAEGLQARAFTVGGDVYIRRSDYRPGTGAGDELIAHELAHTLQQGASRIRRRAVDPIEVHERLDGPHVSFKKQKMHLDFVRMKRMDTNIVRQLSSKALKSMGAKALAEWVKPDDGVGHWWVEVGNLSPDRETWRPTHSYGWYPHHDAAQTVLKTLAIDTPVEGELNEGGDNDHHHGERAGVEFHPVMDVDLDEDSYDEIRWDVMTKIDEFAHSFKGTWNWRFGWGKNCHTFQDRMKEQLGLHYQTSKVWLQAPVVAAPEYTFLDRWDPLVGEGDLIWREGRDPFPEYTWDELSAFTAEQKQQIIDHTRCSVADLNEWCRLTFKQPGAETLFGPAT